MILVLPSVVSEAPRSFVHPYLCFSIIRKKRKCTQSYNLFFGGSTNNFPVSFPITIQVSFWGNLWFSHQCQSLPVQQWMILNRDKWNPQHFICAENQQLPYINPQNQDNVAWPVLVKKCASISFCIHFCIFHVSFLKDIFSNLEYYWCSLGFHKFFIITDI